jgi:hypothetical protein
VMIATAAAPLSGGVAYDFFGEYDPLLWMFAGLSVISAGLVLLVRPEAPVTVPLPTAVSGHATS